MKLSALNLPAAVILVTSHTGGLGASIHSSEADALKDVVRELQQDNNAPDDLEPTIAAISDWIGNEDLIYEFTVQPLSLPGYRVVAVNTATGEVLHSRFVHTHDQAEAEQVAGGVWNQYGAFQPGRGIKVFLYPMTGGDNPLLVIDDDDEEGERTAFFSERGGYWYVDEVQGGERFTIAKNLTEDQARDIEGGNPPFDGVTGDLSPAVPPVVLTEGLPPGYTVEQDMDDDWLLLPPADVTIFSSPGEGVILAAETPEAALIEAKALLNDRNR